MLLLAEIGESRCVATDLLASRIKYDVTIHDFLTKRGGESGMIDRDREDDEIKSWLDGWLSHDASPVDVLRRSWFHGEPQEGSDWTREKELSEWLAASKTNWHAWRGVQVLLKTLRENNHPIPISLVCWALDVASGRSSEPRRPRGRDSTVNTYRDRSIVTAVCALRGCGLPATSNTGRSACHMIAERLNLSYEAVRAVWLRHKNMSLADYLRIERPFERDKDL